jgi:hypothetical protein
MVGGTFSWFQVRLPMSMGSSHKYQYLTGGWAMWRIGLAVVCCSLYMYQCCAADQQDRASRRGLNGENTPKPFVIPMNRTQLANVLGINEDSPHLLNEIAADITSVDYLYRGQKRNSDDANTIQSFVDAIQSASLLKTLGEDYSFAIDIMRDRRYQITFKDKNGQILRHVILRGHPSDGFKMTTWAGIYKIPAIYPLIDEWTRGVDKEIEEKKEVARLALIKMAKEQRTRNQSK